MALNRSNKYPGRFLAPTAARPQGAFKNRTSPTAQDGSYLEADWANDWDGFFARILTVAGVTPNGNVDSGTASQLYDALLSAMPGRLIGTRVFTNSGTYTPSPGAKKIRVYVTAAGGAGGGSLSTSNPRGGGGGAGGTAIKFITLSQAAYPVTVGVGSSIAATGGASAFGSECSASGGGHGTANAGAAGGLATGGDINIQGGQGSDGAVNSNAGGGSGDGGSSYWGGGRRSSTGVDGSAAGAYGAGGGGNQANSGSGGEAAGQNGIVYIEEYS